MNPTRDFARTSLPAFTASRAFHALPTPSAIPQSRAGLPVVSNRAFIGAWMARRNKIAAAAQVVRSN